MDQAKFNQWWRQLTPTQQKALLALNPGDTVPPTLVPGLVRWRGSIVDPDWWDTHDNHTGFPLPPDVHHHIQHRHHGTHPTAARDARVQT